MYESGSIYLFIFSLDVRKLEMGGKKEIHWSTTVKEKQIKEEHKKENMRK